MLQEFTEAEKKKEEWRTVKGFRGYEVSDLGRIRSYCKKGNSGGYNLEDKGRLLKPHPLNKKNPYLRVGLVSDDSGYKQHSMHRIVALAFLENPENKPQVNHLNGIKSDNRVSNLEWTTHSENIKHSYDKLSRPGPQGVLSGSVKLKESDIKIIRGSIEHRNDLAKIFDVSPNTITDIRQRRSWKHIK